MRTKIILALGLLISNLGFCSAVYPPTNQEELRVVAVATQSSANPLLQYVWKRDRDFHGANQKEINHMTAQIAESAKSAEELQSAVKAALESDRAAIQAFNATFKDLPKAALEDSAEEQDRKKVLAQFSAHKLVEGLTGAIALATDPATFARLKGGMLPDGYNMDLGPDGIVFTAGRESIFGNEQARSLKTLLVRTLLVTMGKSSLMDLEGVMGSLYPAGSWIKDSAMAHLIPVPHYARKDLIEGTPYLCEIDGNYYLGHPNSAYEFGGHRQEYALYPTPKWNGPQDCSSGVAELIGMAPEVMRASTFHYYWAYQSMLGKESLVDAGVARVGSTRAVEDVILGELKTLLTLLPIDDLRAEHGKLQPGDIYMYRNFNLATDPGKTFGAGGHGVVVLGFLPAESEDGYPRIVGYEWNRALEKGLDGRGIVERIFQPASDTHFPMFFRPTAAALSRIEDLFAGFRV